MLFVASYAAAANAPHALPATADLRVDIAEFADPPLSRGVFHYGFGVYNDGPDTAVDVVFSDSVAEGLTFHALRLEDSGGNDLEASVEMPSAGTRGIIRVSVAQLAAGDNFRVIVFLNVDAPPLTVTSNVGTASSATFDPVADNNTRDVRYQVPYPPEVFLIKARQADGKPYRIQISGGFLKPYGQGIPFVYIGEEEEVWTRYKLKSEQRLYLTGGAELKRRFPKGTPVPIRIVNFDGGEVTAWFVRE